MSFLVTAIDAVLLVAACVLLVSKCVPIINTVPSNTPLNSQDWYNYGIDVLGVGFQYVNGDYKNLTLMEDGFYHPLVPMADGKLHPLEFVVCEVN